MDITFGTLLDVVEELDTVSSSEAWILYGVALGAIGVGMLIRKVCGMHSDKKSKKAEWDEILWEVYE